MLCHAEQLWRLFSLRSGYYIHVSLNIREICTVSTQCIYVFRVIYQQTAIISLNIIKWLVSVMETECVSCAVRTAFLSMMCPALSKTATLFSNYSITQCNPVGASSLNNLRTSYNMKLNVTNDGVSAANWQASALLAGAALLRHLLTFLFGLT